MEDWYYIFGWLLSVAAVIGNGLVVLLIAKYRRLHSPANWYVLSLAVADFGVGIVVFPLSYLCNSEGTPTLNCNKRIYITAYWFLVHSSVANLCILTWNRYTAIVHPFKYISSMTARHPGRVILLAWLIPLMISLSLSLGMYVTSSYTAWKVLRLTGVSGFDILSCAFLVYGVVRIMIVVRKQLLQDSAMKSLKRDLFPLKQQAQENQLSVEVARRNGRHKSACFIIAIVAFFLGCHVTINYLILRIMFVSDKPRYIGLLITILLVANSTVNPLVYAFLKQDMKKEIARLICGEAKKDNTNNSERSSRQTQTSLITKYI